MKILKDNPSLDYDLSICGLGFESRAIASYDKAQEHIKDLIVLGYKKNTSKFSYQDNKLFFEDKTDYIFEVEDDEVISVLDIQLNELGFDKPLNVLLDITVMSRHRLATILSLLIDKLKENSSLSVTYTLSKFIDPPSGTTPVKKVCEISEGFEGVIGDLSLPTSVIIGLGYEKGKALSLIHI